MITPDGTSAIVCTVIELVLRIEDKAVPIAFLCQEELCEPCGITCIDNTVTTTLPSYVNAFAGIAKACPESAKAYDPEADETSDVVSGAPEDPAGSAGADGSPRLATERGPAATGQPRTTAE